MTEKQTVQRLIDEGFTIDEINKALYLSNNNDIIDGYQQYTFDATDSKNYLLLDEIIKRFETTGSVIYLK